MPLYFVLLGLRRRLSSPSKLHYMLAELPASWRHDGHFDCARLSRPRRRRCRQRRRRDRIFHGVEDDIRSQCYPHGFHNDRRTVIGDPVFRPIGGRIIGVGGGLGSGARGVLGGLLNSLGKK